MQASRICATTFSGSGIEVSNLEIERKYLVRIAPDVSRLQGEEITQGYLFGSEGPGPSIRIRKTDQANVLTIKVPVSEGPGRQQGLAPLQRRELDFPVPPREADDLLVACAGRVLQKTRYRIPHGRHLIELDFFKGALQGMLLAEVELSAADDVFQPPSWFGPEVTQDPNFSSYSLASRGRTINKLQ